MLAKLLMIRKDIPGIWNETFKWHVYDLKWHSAVLRLLDCCAFQIISIMTITDLQMTRNQPLNDLNVILKTSNDLLLESPSMKWGHWNDLLMTSDNLTANLNDLICYWLKMTWWWNCIGTILRWSWPEIICKWPDGGITCTL